MTKKSNQSRVRAAIRRIRRNRHQRRYTAIALLTLLTIGVFSALALNYLDRGYRFIGEPRVTRVDYTLPALPPILVPLETPSVPMPKLLDLSALFTDSDGYESHRPDPNAKKSGLDRSDPQQPSIAILDDLRAAPPKSIFIKAVFGLPPVPWAREQDRWGRRDHHGGHHGGHRHGHHHDHDPPVPEPSTGLLLGLGLTAIGISRRRSRTRTARRSQNIAIPPSRTTDFMDGD